MKPATRVLDVTTNMQGERVGMTIDDSALAHIMSVLTDLYSDPELACIREYSTNALDAHIDAKIKRPIEVSIPSALSPFFKVRDYGEGLDMNDIREIYSRYGTSTKRNSNDVVGMLGLGCKSALTYTDQFTLTAVKNGKMIQVSISRDEDGAGSMTILDERDTDMEQGVEVMIPAKFGNSFEKKANHFFSFWQKGTVLVNGKEPKQIDGIWLSDNLLLTNEVDTSYVVMGNVAYPFLDEHNHGYGHYSSFRVVAYVNIGDVHFTPSRESLQATKATHQTLKSVTERVKKEKDAKFEEMIETAATRAEAFEMYNKVVAMGYTGDPEYKGEKIPLSWNPPVHDVPLTNLDGSPRLDYNGKQRIVSEYEYNFVVVSKVKSYYRRSKSWATSTNLGHEPGKYAWVQGYKSDQFTPYKREKMEQYLSKHPVPASVQSLVFVPSLPSGVKEWVAPNLILNWSDIEAEKIVRENVKRNDGRPSGSYKGWVADVADEAILAADIDTSKPIFWYHGHNNSYYRPEQQKEVMKRNPDATFILLGGNRIEKFKRDFPMAKSAETYLKEVADTWSKNLTPDDLFALHLVTDARDTAARLRVLDETKIDDPELSAAISMAKNKQKRGKELHEEYCVLYRYGATLNGKVKWTNPLEKYVLLHELSSYGRLTGVTKDHLYCYFNAAFAASEKGEL